MDIFMLNLNTPLMGTDTSGCIPQASNVSMTSSLTQLHARRLVLRMKDSRWNFIGI